MQPLFCMEDDMIRKCTQDEVGQIKALDRLSGNHVEKHLLHKDRDVYGIMVKGKLIGYCTLGNSEETKELLKDYPDFPIETLSLNDVFIMEEYRGLGYCTKMLCEILNTIKGKYVFLNLFHAQLSKLYRKIGFIHLNEYTMVKKL